MSSVADAVVAPEVAPEEIGVKEEILKKNGNASVIENIVHTNGKNHVMQADEEDSNGAALQGDEEDEVDEVEDEGDLNDEEDDEEKNGDDEEEDEDEEQIEEAEVEENGRTNGNAESKNGGELNGSAKSRKRVNEIDGEEDEAVLESPTQKKVRSEHETEAEAQPVA